MKIVKNTSGYDTRAIRAVIVLAHNYIKQSEKRAAPNWSRLRVLVRGRDEGKHVSGRAFLGGCGGYHKSWDVCLTVCRPVLHARTLLALAHHELMHVYGYEHGKFRDLTDEEQITLIPTNYEMPKPAGKPKASPDDRKAKRVASLIERQKQWQTRAKRAQTALKKIRKSLRHYERNEPALLAAYRSK